MINFWGYFNMVVYFFALPLLSILLGTAWPMLGMIALIWTLDWAKS